MEVAKNGSAKQYTKKDVPLVITVCGHINMSFHENENVQLDLLGIKMHMHRCVEKGFISVATREKTTNEEGKWNIWDNSCCYHQEYDTLSTVQFFLPVSVSFRD